MHEKHKEYLHKANITSPRMDVMLPDNLGNCNVSKSDNVNEHETSFSKTDNNYWPHGTFVIVGDSRLEYMLKVDNRNTRARCEICSKLTIKTPERGHWRRSGVFIVKFEHISLFILVFPLLTLSKKMPAGVGRINLFSQSSRKSLSS